MSLSRRWRKAFGSTPEPGARRWVVLDLESSGLDARRDRLLAVAGIGLHFDNGSPRIVIGDSFEVVLRQPQPTTDKANVLLHGIGVAAQRGGVEAPLALSALTQWLADAPLVAFHAVFDQTLIQRTLLSVLGRRLDNPWLDLAPVAAALHPGAAARGLDEWLDYFDIRCAARHQAAADTLATAELLLKLWPALRAQKAGVDHAALQRLAAQARWLQR